MLQVLKLLFALKSWKNGRSKTLDFSALLMLLPVLDASFFGSEVGMMVVHGFYWVLAKIPFLPVPSMEQAVAFLVFTIGGVVAWLRALTTQSLSAKDQAQ